VTNSSSSSIFIFATFTVPANSASTSSNIGAKALQGPHHEAQKSTTTGSLDCNTSFSKFSFVICKIAILSPPFSRIVIFSNLYSYYILFFSFCLEFLYIFTQLYFLTILSATIAALLFDNTSCTLTISIPFSIPKTVVATVPSTLS